MNLHLDDNGSFGMIFHLTVTPPQNFTESKVLTNIQKDVYRSFPLGAISQTGEHGSYTIRAFIKNDLVFDAKVSYGELKVDERELEKVLKGPTEFKERVIKDLLIKVCNMAIQENLDNIMKGFEKCNS